MEGLDFEGGEESEIAKKSREANCGGSAFQSVKSYNLATSYLKGGTEV